ncbi:hypothetical protein LTR84_004678 [Exophiala bonariae]|uniref:Uncharacterized protein n=1 Tax=Exophiala bonariae TaxID=1690606 RepID=A0AAV9NN35_9EURO|nr:hypothetical protein LTR84_004678 [Exophiala bonariae]
MQPALHGFGGMVLNMSRASEEAITTRGKALLKSAMGKIQLSVPEFIEPHRITVLGNRALTDEILVLRSMPKNTEAVAAENVAMKIVAVFEYKAGKASSWGLVCSGYTSFEKFPKYWQDSIRV